MNLLFARIATLILILISFFTVPAHKEFSNLILKILFLDTLSDGDKRDVHVL